MKSKRFKIKRKKYMTVMAVILMSAVFLLAGPVMAADNVGTGDIGGDGASLNNSNTFSLFSTTMSLNKMAFLSNGTALANSTTLPRGTEVRFVLYVDNTTNIPLNDVSIQDVLDPAFAYQAGSMRVDGTIPSGASQAVIYSTVNAAAIVSDAVDGNVASYASSTINAGNQNAANTTLDIAGNSVWAILFRTLMQ